MRLTAGAMLSAMALMLCGCGQEHVPRKAGFRAAPLSRFELAENRKKEDLSFLRGTIVFVSDRDGIPKIWSMHASGQDPRRLTDGNSADADPRLAPDGTEILYTTHRPGSPEIWLRKRDGSKPRLLTRGEHGNWSPDGRAVAFVREHRIYVRELASGRERCVTPRSQQDSGEVVWCPDRTHLTFASGASAGPALWLVNLASGQVSRLSGEEPCCEPRWFRGGKKILCRSEQGHICEFDADGSNWTQLTFGADVQQNALYSPDGTMILFCRAPGPAGPWQICVQKLKSDDSAFIQITYEGSNTSPDWHAVE